MPRLYYGILPPQEYKKVFELNDRGETWFVYVGKKGDWENYRIVKHKEPDLHKGNYYIGYLPSECRFAKGSEYNTMKLRRPEMLNMLENKIKAVQ